YVAVICAPVWPFVAAFTVYAFVLAVLALVTARVATPLASVTADTSPDDGTAAPLAVRSLSEIPLVPASVNQTVAPAILTLAAPVAVAVYVTVAVPARSCRCSRQRSTESSS